MDVRDCFCPVRSSLTWPVAQPHLAADRVKLQLADLEDTMGALLTQRRSTAAIRAASSG